MRFIVIGGGILGLATAYQLTASQPDAEVLVLEKEPDIGRHQTSHNSGVVHAGLYYTPGSLKARLCRRGVGLLREFCFERGIRYEARGKLVVAVDERELEPLRRLAERAAANEVPGLRWLDGTSAIRSVEPHAAGIAALQSPATAVVDFLAVARALAAAVAVAGGRVRTGAAATRVERSSGRVEVTLADGSIVAGDRAVVCAGLLADRLARASGEPENPRIVPFRGEYWQMAPERSSLVRGLIYPVPDPRLPFLGVHLTRRIDDTVLLGPNALLSLSRDGYRRRSLRARDALETLTWPGTLRMMRRHWKAGAAELWRALRPQTFVREARRYVPELRLDDLKPAPAGIRAQAVDRDGSLVDDFRLSAGGGVVWVRNAPSPAATSALAIAEELVARVLR